MTVTYSADVNTVRFTTFTKLLFKWKGSMWKAVYQEFFFWLFLYTIIALIYHILLTEEEKRVFEDVAVFVSKYTDFIPLTFMLGFFINVVVSRWWTMYMNMGWIDIPAIYVCNYISGHDEYGRLLRRTIIRFLLFYQVLVYRDISEVIRRRFPTLETLISAGYITESELQHLTAIPSKCKKYWVPINWAMNIARRARREKRIDCDHAQQDIFKVIIEFRKKLQLLIRYDWAPIPLVYTQVVCLTVRIYFCLTLICRQKLDASPDPAYLQSVNIYIPVMSMFQFLFYMGWLKVAEVLLNPFGDDDDDFEINWLIDRNLRVGLTIADEIWEAPLVRDAFWTARAAEPMYSVDTVHERCNPQVGSVSNLMALKVRRTSVQMIPRMSANENEEECEMAAEHHIERGASYVSASSPIFFGAFRRKLSQLTSRMSSANDLESATSLDHCDLQNKESRKTFVEQTAEIIEILQQQSDMKKPSNPVSSSSTPIPKFQQNLSSTKVFEEKQELDVVEEESDRSRKLSTGTDSTDGIEKKRYKRMKGKAKTSKPQVESDDDDNGVARKSSSERREAAAATTTASGSSNDGAETEFESALDSPDETPTESIQRSQGEILNVPHSGPHLMTKYDKLK